MPEPGINKKKFFSYVSTNNCFQADCCAKNLFTLAYYWLVFQKDIVLKKLQIITVLSFIRSPDASFFSYNFALRLYVYACLFFYEFWSVVH